MDLKKIVSGELKDLHNANLHNANLYNANLYNADLRYADLRYANLNNADLRYANLYNANLHNANLYNANLYNADLRYADLRNANLYNADLRNADLRYANLNWNSHVLLSEVLWQAAKTVEQRMAAAYVGRELNACWKDFLALPIDKKWAIEVLKQYEGWEEYLKEEN